VQKEIFLLLKAQISKSLFPTIHTEKTLDIPTDLPIKTRLSLTPHKNKKLNLETLLLLLKW
jgi:hypothetical protein